MSFLFLGSNETMQFKRFSLAALLLALALIGAAFPGEGRAAEEALSPEKTTNLKLNDIINNLAAQAKELKSKAAALKKAKTVKNKKALEAEVAAIDQSIAEQRRSFEMIVTGGLELDRINGAQEKKFDWQKDLLDILQPIMSELRQLTEKKRKEESLKNKIAFHQGQARVIEEALNHIAETDPEGLEKKALARFKSIKTEWTARGEENNHLLEIAQLQLDEMKKAEAALEVSAGDRLKAFATGRGATLLMAVAAFLVIFLGLRGVWAVIRRSFGTNRPKKKKYYQRLLGMVYKLVTLLLALIAVLYVFNERNDRVLLAVTVLLLVGVAWVLKNSLPGYVDEIKLLLNVGPVREGERVLYNGIPMLVGNLNVHTYLTNPDIPGVAVRAPLEMLSSMTSRKWREDEPWFPCREGDWVLLSDGAYGLVKTISLETVVLRRAGGSMQGMSVGDFLGANPTNLSTGFLVTTVFGIDYKYQDRSITEIPHLFEAGIRKGVEGESFGSHLTSLSVDFNAASASSLDYKIMAGFSGEAAGDYYPILRALQRHAVAVCNRHGLEIPFNQLAIHYDQPQG